MDGAVVTGDVKAVGEVALASDIEGVADAFVVGVESQDARHEGTIGAVTSVGVGKAVPKGEGHLGDVSVNERGGDLGAAQRPCGVGGRGAHHDGAEDLECRGRGKGLRGS